MTVPRRIFIPCRDLFLCRKWNLYLFFTVAASIVYRSQSIFHGRMCFCILCTRLKEIWWKWFSPDLRKRKPQLMLNRNNGKFPLLHNPFPFSIEKHSPSRCYLLTFSGVKAFSPVFLWKSIFNQRGREPFSAISHTRSRNKFHHRKKKKKKKTALPQQTIENESFTFRFIKCI